MHKSRMKWIKFNVKSPVLSKFFPETHMQFIALQDGQMMFINIRIPFKIIRNWKIVEFTLLNISSDYVRSESE